jgi:hypothetical protein
MSKHMKFSEFEENPDNCFGFGFYIHYTDVHFLQQILFLYSWGSKQIIPTKKFEDAGTSIFASGDRATGCGVYMYV